MNERFKRESIFLMAVYLQGWYLGLNLTCMVELSWYEDPFQSTDFTGQQLETTQILTLEGGVSKSKNAADGDNDLDLQGITLKTGKLERSEKYCNIISFI